MNEPRLGPSMPIPFKDQWAKVFNSYIFDFKEYERIESIEETILYAVAIPFGGYKRHNFDYEFECMLDCCFAPIKFGGPYNEKSYYKSL